LYPRAVVRLDIGCRGWTVRAPPGSRRRHLARLVHRLRSGLLQHQRQPRRTGSESLRPGKTV